MKQTSDAAIPPIARSGGSREPERPVRGTNMVKTPSTSCALSMTGRLAPSADNRVNVRVHSRFWCVLSMAFCSRKSHRIPWKASGKAIHTRKMNAEQILRYVRMMRHTVHNSCVARKHPRP